MLVTVSLLTICKDLLVNSQTPEKLPASKFFEKIIHLVTHLANHMT